MRSGVSISVSQVSERQTGVWQGKLSHSLVVGKPSLLLVHKRFGQVYLYEALRVLEATKFQQWLEGDAIVMRQMTHPKIQVQQAKMPLPVAANSGPVSATSDSISDGSNVKMKLK